MEAPRNTPISNQCVPNGFKTLTNSSAVGDLEGGMGPSAPVRLSEAIENKSVSNDHLFVTSVHYT